MSDEDERRGPGDIALARRIGDKFGRRLTGWSGSLLYGFYAQQPLSQARRLLRGLLGDLVKEGGDRSPESRSRPLLATETMFELVGTLDAMLRLTNFSRSIDLGGMLVFKAGTNAFNIAPTFDFFNSRARRSLAGWDEGRYLHYHAADPNYLRHCVRGIADFRDHVAMVSQREAVTGFMTLFADSLRAAMRAFVSSNTSYITYTVHSKNSQYQLEYFPQCNYSPTVFGSTLTTPVVDKIKIGHYHFQGWHENTLVRDPGVYFAAPGAISTHLSQLQNRSDSVIFFADF